MNYMENNVKKEKLAIFDLDGTLFDTSDVNYYAYKDALEQVGISLDYDFFVNQCMGKHYKVFLSGLVDDNELEKVHNLKKHAYSRHLERARENKQLFELIRCIRVSYYIVIATTASKKNTMELLKTFGNDSLFDAIYTQDDFTRMKPDPQCFLIAMEQFGISAENTVIFEDSQVGIEAALKSGASVLKVQRF